MEKLLEKLYKLKIDEEIKKICGDRVFMNNRNASVQLPYISYNPFLSSKPLLQTVSCKGYTVSYEKHTVQVNAYMKNNADLPRLYKAITKVMSNQFFRRVGYHVETTDKGQTWLILRYEIRL